MGFFGKLKQNMHHGGVKVELQAPAGVRVTDPALPAVITVTATDQPVHVNSVRLEIQGTSQDMANSNSRQPMFKTFAQAASNQPFDLQPGQSQQVQLSITLDPTAAAAPGGMLGKLEKTAAGIAQSAMMGNYNYSLVATADVEGIAMDPAARQGLAIWKVGEIGLTKNF